MKTPRFSTVNIHTLFLTTILLFTIISSNYASIASEETCTHPDYDALISLYNATDGPNWLDNTGWVDGAQELDCEPCMWFGVSCNEEGRVSCLDLDGLLGCSNFMINSGNGLNGEIPAEIKNLTELEGLYLEGNANLTGIIPEEVYELSSLEVLITSFTGISGSISPSVANLTNLRIFNTGINNMSGPIPSEFEQITTLESLTLQFANFTGEIPSGIGNLPNLTELRLNSNNLEGCIPFSLNNLCDVGSIDLSGNPNLPGGGDFEAFCDTGEGSCEPPCSDLIIEVSVSNVEGGLVEYNYTITNIGNGAADLNGTTADNFTNVSIQNFFTNDPDPANFPNGQAAGGSIIGLSPLPILQSGDSYNGSFQANGYDGSYQYLALKVDWGERIDECNEMNNIVILEGGCMDEFANNYNPFADFDNDTCITCDDGIQNGDEEGIDCGGSACGPCNYNDFFIANQYINKSTVAPGKKIKAICDQSYEGTSNSTLTVWMRYYWSEDTTLDDSDIIMGKDKSTLKVSDTFDKEKINYKVPSNTEDGTYYVLFRTDYKEEFDESNEDNNIEWASIVVSSNSNTISSAHLPENTFLNPIVQKSNLPSTNQKSISISKLEKEITEYIVFPNPFNTLLTIDIRENEEDVSYEIININGKIISQGILSGSDNLINTSEILPGFYILRLTNNSNNSKMFTIIKS